MDKTLKRLDINDKMQRFADPSDRDAGLARRGLRPCPRAVVERSAGLTAAAGAVKKAS